MSQYTISKLKTFDGMQGQGFSLALLRDGKTVAEVINNARGGAFIFRWVDIEARATVKTVDYKDEPCEFGGTVEEAMFHAYALTLPKHKHFDRLSFLTPDMVVEQMVDALQCERRLKRAFKTKIVFIEKGIPYSYPVRAGQNLDVVMAAVKKHYPDAVMLNPLPVEEALALAIQAGF
ncbi:hypothetical protein [Paraburkholderia xenovorans]